MVSSILVVGGTGFVGSRVVRAALAQGLKVASITRSGAPPADVARELQGAQWLAADAENRPALDEALRGCDAVISCLGAFGSDELMRRINGDANAQIAAAAKDGGVKRFVYISVAPFGPVESFPLLRGYFAGKRAAEVAVDDYFGECGVVMKPGMVYGSRRISSAVSLPLGAVGAPLSLLLSTPPLRTLARTLGWLGEPLAPPIAVDTLAHAAVAAACGASPPDASGRGDGGAHLVEWREMEEMSSAALRAAPSEVSLFWDGGCPLCRKEIEVYQRLDSDGRVAWVDIDAQPEAIEAHGVSVQKAMARIHAVDADGKLQIGVPAFMCVWDRLPYWWVLPPLLRTLPGMLPAANALYSVFAKHRSRLTGDSR